MPVNGWNFHKQDKPATSDQIIEMHYDYYLHAIECFGVDRCMFESNFPVDRRSMYLIMYYGMPLKKWSSNYSNEDKNKLFFQNAKDSLRSIVTTFCPQYNRLKPRDTFLLAFLGLLELHPSNPFDFTPFC